MAVDKEQTEESANRAESVRGSNHAATNNQQPILPNGDASQESGYYQNLLYQLFESIRKGDQATINRLVTVIRSGDSRQEILGGLSDLLGATGQPNQNGNQADGQNGRDAG